MKLMKNEIISASIVGVLVCALVWLHIPKPINGNTQQTGTAKIVLKSFVVSFVISFMVFYFLGDTESKDALDHVMKGEPDF
jgi:hypothetical protein